MQKKILLCIDRNRDNSAEDFEAEDNLPILSISLYYSLLQLISFSSSNPLQARQMRNVPAQQVLASLLLPIALHLLLSLPPLSPSCGWQNTPIIAAKWATSNRSSCSCLASHCHDFNLIKRCQDAAVSPRKTCSNRKSCGFTRNKSDIASTSSQSNRKCVDPLRLLWLHSEKTNSNCVG